MTCVASTALQHCSLDHTVPGTSGLASEHGTEKAPALSDKEQGSSKTS